jgi:OOP family OmpA-OmpF porin
LRKDKDIMTNLNTILWRGALIAGVAFTLSGCWTRHDWRQVANPPPCVQCVEPAPPVVAAVPVPVPVDTDGDGVFDNVDRCPNTPRGTVVDAAGCSCEVAVQLNFAFDKSELTPLDRSKLDGLIAEVGGPQNVGGRVTGHTDNFGSDDYNVALALRRSQSATDYLVSRGADRSGLIVLGRGEFEPIATNATPEGRAINRRVVLTRACAVR